MRACHRQEGIVDIETFDRWANFLKENKVAYLRGDNRNLVYEIKTTIIVPKNEPSPGNVDRSTRNSDAALPRITTDRAKSHRRSKLG